MARGRGRFAVAGMFGALALAAAGCGAQSHSNDPRPQAATRVSVTILPDRVIVQPRRVAFGPERSQQIPQNRNWEQPRIDTDAPLDVVVVAANQTTVDTPLVIRGPGEAESEPVLARSPGTLQTQLPTGAYTITAPDLPRAEAAKLTIGPYRASSQNDVLEP